MFDCFGLDSLAARCYTFLAPRYVETSIIYPLILYFVNQKANIGVFHSRSSLLTESRLMFFFMLLDYIIDAGPGLEFVCHSLER
jgi:hypothetical protein